MEKENILKNCIFVLEKKRKKGKGKKKKKK